MRASLLFTVIWVGWALSWIAAAGWTGRTEKRVPAPDAWIYRLMVTAGAVLLWDQTGQIFGGRRFWHLGPAGVAGLATLALCGILFAWWARLHLGRLWSSSVTRKEGHHVVDSGPYALVRHPIYTGLILAVIATAAAEATVPAGAGAVLVATGLWLKARIEERFLEAELDEDSYARYRRRVPMLVPLFPAGE